MSTAPVNEEQLNRFMEVYEPQLVTVVTENGGEYGYGPAGVPVVAKKMRGAFLTGTYNKDGMAIKRTCKILGIPFTYKGINAFLAGGAV